MRAEIVEEEVTPRKPIRGTFAGGCARADGHSDASTRPWAAQRAAFVTIGPGPPAPVTRSPSRGSGSRQASREVLEGGAERERGGLAEPTERGQLHHVGQLAEPVERFADSVPVDAVQQVQEPRRALATGRALAAGLARVEGEEAPHPRRGVGRVVERDDPTGPGGQGRALERPIEEGRRDDDPRRPADDDRAERAAGREAAAQALDQPPERERRRRL